MHTGQSDQFGPIRVDSVKLGSSKVDSGQSFFFRSYRGYVEFWLNLDKFRGVCINFLDSDEASYVKANLA